MNDKGFRATKGGVDLNLERQFQAVCGVFRRHGHEHWQDPVRTDHGFVAVDDLHSLRSAVRWRLYSVSLAGERSISILYRVGKELRHARYAVATLDKEFEREVTAIPGIAHRN